MKPLLAATLEKITDLDATRPYMVSPKLDGIRCLRVGGECVSRNMKPIRNRYIQRMLTALPDGLDGELVSGDPAGQMVLNRTVSAVMSEFGEPEFKYHIFDNYMTSGPFRTRHLSLVRIVSPHVTIVPHYTLHADEIEDLERVIITAGYEGIMIRGCDGKYKQGRSTHNDGILWKFKRFRDGEAIVTSIAEGMTNNNLPIVNGTGYTERSTHKENLQPNGQVGTIFGIDIKTRDAVVLSPGRMTHEMRKYFLNRPHEIVGRLVNYKTFDYGTVDNPRFSTFQSFRDYE